VAEKDYPHRKALLPGMLDYIYADIALANVSRKYKEFLKFDFSRNFTISRIKKPF
jgi:hypothetical protein